MISNQKGSPMLPNPSLPPRDLPAPTGFPMSASDARIAAREDESILNDEIDEAIRRCLAEGIS